MGLKINKQVNAMGFQLNQLYCRLHLRYYFTGNKVEVWAQNYASKEAFKENINNSFLVDGIRMQYQFDYDRDLDGSDILLFCHEKIKKQLTTDITEEREVTVENSEGKQSKEVKTTVIKEKFCKPEEAQIELTTQTTSTKKN